MTVCSAVQSIMLSVMLSSVFNISRNFNYCIITFNFIFVTYRCDTTCFYFYYFTLVFSTTTKQKLLHFNQNKEACEY